MRRLRHIGSLEDLAAPARRRLPHCIFSYVMFGVETGQSLRANREAFLDRSFTPRVLRDVSKRQTATVLFGRTYSVPFGVAPMGAVCLAHPLGDIALARAAARANAPFILSGASTVPLERIARENPAAWFQAYLPVGQEKIAALVDRVAAAGFQTLVVTADVPVPSNREQLERAGYTVPLRPTVKLALDGLCHPRWLFGTALRTLVRHGMPYLENMTARRGPAMLHSKALRSHTRDALSWEDMKRIRARWNGKLVIKGILSVDDALTARSVGVDGILVSNHGGRQLDGAVSPLRVLPDIVTAVPGMTILYDGGIRRGTDVLKAMALGAHGVFLGRPFMYAVAIAGEEGVLRAIEILREEVDRDLALLGCVDFSDLSSRVLPARS
jgi:L-lactate dehydrogenase (cytochrome)